LANSGERTAAIGRLAKIQHGDGGMAGKQKATDKKRSSKKSNETAKKL
jgi:hypothetical protein